jgi:hypothetical protein
MKKAPRTGTKACHDTLTQSNCHLQAGACNRDLDGLVFSFFAVLPASTVFAPHTATQLTLFHLKTAMRLAIRRLTPPPKVCFA